MILHNGNATAPGSDSRPSSYQLVRRFYREFVARHKRIGLWAIAVMVVVVVLQFPFPFISMYIIDELIPQGGTQQILVIGSLLLVLVALLAGLRFLQSYLLTVFKERVMYDAQVRYFRHIQSLPMAFFRTHHSGYLQSRFCEVRQADGILTTVLLNGVTNLATLLVATAAMSYLDVRVTLITALTVPPLIWASIYLGKRIRSLVVQMSELAGRLAGNVVETFSSLLAVRALGLQHRQTARIQEGLLAQRKVNIRTSLLSNVNGVARSTILSAGLILVVTVGAYETVSGRMTVGEIFAMTALLTYLYNPVLGLVGLNQDIQGALASVGRLYDHLGLPVEPGEDDWQTEEAVPRQPVEITPSARRGDTVPIVEFRGVGFTYGSAPVLRGLDLAIQPGSVVALVGHSGAGKSTLVHVLLRLYEPTEGTIRIGGRDIHEISKSDLRRQIALVPQDPILFQGTLRENLECGLGPFAPAEIERALHSANAYDLVQGLPDKLDTVVGERGFSLSGGEKQRICIARAFLRDPAIVILDEATSSVDSTSESLIQEAVRNFRSDKTVIIIGHRLSTVIDSDRIAVLQDGRIVEQGNHRQLFSKGGAYTELYKDQCLEALEEDGSQSALPTQAAGNA